MKVTFNQQAQAAKFNGLVDEAGNRMRATKLLEAYGLHGALGDQAASDRPTVVQRITVSDLCWLYLEAALVREAGC